MSLKTTLALFLFLMVLLRARRARGDRASR